MQLSNGEDIVEEESVDEVQRDDRDEHDQEQRREVPHRQTKDPVEKHGWSLVTTRFAG